jgi:hypothetical protein
MTPAILQEESMKCRLNNGFSSRLSVGLLSGVVLLMVSAHSPATAASPSEELKGVFTKMERQLCRSMSLANCKKQVRQKKAKTRKAIAKKPVKSKAAVAEKKSEEQKVAAPLPTPVLKKPKPESAAQIETSQTTLIPTPVLKPVSMTAPTVKTAVPIPVEKKRPVEILPEKKVAVLPAPLPPLLHASPPIMHGMPDGTPMGDACLDQLGSLGVKFSRAPTTVGMGACSVSDAVQVQSMVASGEILKFPDQPTWTCGFAVKFASWVRQEAIPIVKSATQTAISSVGTGPGYQCRGRNGDISAKLSEHAFGNAVDIERIKLADGAVIEVKDAMTIGAKYQPVLATLRASSCTYFTTVLGPGANAAHATHFHFDLARRGKKGNHAMCQ